MKKSDTSRRNIVFTKASNEKFLQSWMLLSTFTSLGCSSHHPRRLLGNFILHFMTRPGACIGNDAVLTLRRSCLAFSQSMHLHANKISSALFKAEIFLVAFSFPLTLPPFFFLILFFVFYLFSSLSSSLLFLFLFFFFQ